MNVFTEKGHSSALRARRSRRTSLGREQVLRLWWVFAERVRLSCTVSSPYTSLCSALLGRENKLGANEMRWRCAWL